MSFKSYRIAYGINHFLLITYVIAAFVIISIVDKHTQEAALEEAELKAHMLMARNLTTHKYFSAQLKPNVFQLLDGHYHTGHFDPSWMSSSYAIREMFHMMKEKEEFASYYYKDAAINARNPENEADDFEKDFIRKVNANSNLEMFSDVRFVDGKPFFVTLHRGEKMEKGCMRCHSAPEIAPSDLVERYGPTRSFNRKIDEFVSVISVKIPLEDAFLRADKQSWKLKKLLLAALGFLFVLQLYLANNLKRNNSMLKQEVREKKKIQEKLQKKSHDLSERVKELNGVYELSRLIEDHTLSMDDICSRLVHIIPTSWQFPEITCAKIVFYRNEYATDNFTMSKWSQSSAIRVEDEQIGLIQICYLEEKPQGDEGPFAKEERMLLDDLASKLGTAAEYRIGEQAVRSSERRYRDLVETSQNLIWECNSKGRFIYLNPEWENVLGYSVEEMLGRNFGDFQPPEAFTRDFRLFQRLITGSSAKGYETTFFTQSGERVTLLFNAIPHVNENGENIGTQGTATDITERKMAEEKVAASLVEKEVLLKEVHHRVKNNMQVVCSLLNLQAFMIDDPVVSDLFQESQNRINSMALVHEMLYKKNDFNQISAAEYFTALVETVTGAAEPEVFLVKDIVVDDELYFVPDILIPCGLIVNELVSNTLKHGVVKNDGHENLLSLHLVKNTDGSVRLIVSDNGPGLPLGAELEQYAGLGLKLVVSLVRQLGGSISMTDKPGAGFQISFFPEIP